MDVIDRDLKNIISELSKDELNRFKNKNIFISGTNGFLGNWFLAFFNYINKNVYTTHDRCTVIHGDTKTMDITERGCLESIPRCHFYINGAGIASPKWYKKQPFKTLDVSYTGTVNVFNKALLDEAESVMSFSSSEVYGDPPAEYIPTPETYTGQIPTMSSRSCYDVGKLVIETLSDIFYNEYKLPVKVIRPFNLYGPYMRLDDGRMMANLCKSIAENDIMSVYGDGTQTRTYCYVADAILLMIKALLSDKNGEVFNVGSEDIEMSAYDVCKTTYEILNGDIDNLRIIEHPSFYPKDEPTRRKPDISKIVSAFGNKPATTFDQGIKKTYEYVLTTYTQNEYNLYYGGTVFPDKRKENR